VLWQRIVLQFFRGHGVVFTAMRALVYAVVNVSPSVCLSIAIRYRVTTVRYIVEILSPPNNLIILVLSELTAVAKFRWDQTNGHRWST